MDKKNYDIHDPNHPGIEGDTEIDFFEGIFLESKNIVKLIENRNKRKLHEE